MNEEERIIRSIKYIINQNYVDTEDDIIGILIKALNLIEKQSKEIKKINYIKRSFDYCVEQEIEKLNKSDTSKEQSSMYYYNLYEKLVDKISCCTAQNCEALNNAIREGLENQKLRDKLEESEARLQEEINEVCKLKAELYENDVKKYFIKKAEG